MVAGGGGTVLYRLAAPFVGDLQIAAELPDGHRRIYCGVFRVLHEGDFAGCNGHIFCAVDAGLGIVFRWCVGVADDEWSTTVAGTCAAQRRSEPRGVSRRRREAGCLAGRIVVSRVGVDCFGALHNQAFVEISEF